MTKELNVFKLEVLPAADVFPMMAPEELDELAADIAANGLREPLVVAEVDGETLLVDGRNRRAACKKADVTPPVRMLNGEDPVAYVFSANILRRHMSKGQQAMATAMLYPEPDERGRGKKGETKKLLLNSNFSRQLLDHAREVLRGKGGADLARKVLAGKLSLTEALTDVRGSEEAEKRHGEIVELLTDHAPDLMELVAQNKLTVAEAKAAYEKRGHEDQSKRESLFIALRKAADALANFHKDEMLPRLDELLADKHVARDFERLSGSTPKGWTKILNGMRDEIAAIERAMKTVAK